MSGDSKLVHLSPATVANNNNRPTNQPHEHEHEHELQQKHSVPSSPRHDTPSISATARTSLGHSPDSSVPHPRPPLQDLRRRWPRRWRYCLAPEQWSTAGELGEPYSLGPGDCTAPGSAMDKSSLKALKFMKPCTE